MYDRDYEPRPGGSGLGLVTLLIGVVAGAAALLLATKPGRLLLGQASERADSWKAQASAAIAETREKVVSSVEAETSSPSNPGPQVRTNF